jgi:hypothetical protein
MHAGLQLPDGSPDVATAEAAAALADIALLFPASGPPPAGPETAEVALLLDYDSYFMLTGTYTYPSARLGLVD